MRYILSLILLCCMSIPSFAVKRYPTSITAPYGGTAQTVCQGSSNTATTVTYAICGTTGTGAALSVTPKWYLNGALVFTGAAFNTTAGGGTITLAAASFTYATAGTFSGTNGLKCILTWTGASPAACGAVTTITGTPTNVTVTATPGTITGASAVCIGNSISLTDAPAGGTWTSSNSTIATVGLSSGVVSGAAAGSVNISYNIGSCVVLKAVTVSAPATPITGASTVCIGGTTPLSDLTAGGTWTSSNNSVATIGLTAPTVYGVTPGTTTISYNTAGGCSVTKLINSLALPTAITGSNNVCIGSSIDLSDGGTGGTWSSAPSGIATVSSSGVVSGIAAGTSVIMYSNSCGSPTLTVTVNPLPAAITGITSVCVGGTTTLSDATASGTWSSSNFTAATADPASGVITGVSASIPYITYTLPTGCFTTTTVIVNAAPAPVSGPTAVCYGLSISLSDASTSGTWSSSASSVATISATGVVTGSMAGTAVIRYINGCGADAASTITVNPLPQPITGIMSACYLLTTILSDADAGGTWASGSTSIATAGSTSGIITGVNIGTAPITYTLPTTCIITTTVTITPPPTAVVGANNVCVGQTIPLTDATSAGVWSSSDATLASVIDTSGIVTGVSMGIVNITYQIGTGCIAIQSVTVSPLAPVTGADSLCRGSGTYLTDIIGGGTWASDFSGIATIDTITGHVMGVGPGTANITYTTPAGCMATHSLTIIALPAPISGVTHTCPGATTVLSDTHTGGVWSSLNPGVATVSSSGVVHGVFADTTTITYTVMPGCAVSTSLIVNPLPAPITGDISLCATITDTLHDATPGGVWSSATLSLATVGSASGIVTAVSGGNAIINYTLPVTGCKSTDTIVIHPLPVPVITYNFGTASFYTNTIYVTYQWHDSLQGLITGATSPTLAALYTEYYYVVVTDTFGCTGTSALYHFDASTLHSAIIQPSSITIYPNPVIAILNINAPINISAVISSIDGKQLIRQRNAKEIDVSALAPGIYFISLYSDQMQLISTRKLIKE